MADFSQIEVDSPPDLKWQSLTLDDIKSPEKRSVISGPFGSNISSKFFTEAGIPVIRGNNLSNKIGNKFNDSGFVFISTAKADELNSWAEKDDLIFTGAGTIGQVGLITGQESYNRYTISNKQLRVRLDKEKVNPYFAYYWFASPAIVDLILQRDTGSTIPLINLSVLKSLPILLPPLPEQKAIAEVLSSLDDKIDLLHRNNKTLEQMSETIFRQFFSDEAKMSTVGQEFIVTMGQSPPGETYNKDFLGVPFFQGRTDFTMRFPTKRIYCTAPTRMAKAFDTLLSVRAPVGDINLAYEDCCIGRGIAAIRFKDQSVHYSYANNMMKYLRDAFDIHEDSGTVFGSISKDELLKLPCPILQDGAIYNTRVALLEDKITANCVQISQLMELRDSLLPKLLSGQVRVNMN
jgi:type I restriction enzyme S subunit